MMNTLWKNFYDVIVVGAGNAALCAALSAKENGARVLILEKAPFKERGGNTYFTDAAFRLPYKTEDIQSITRIDKKIYNIIPFSQKQFFNEFMQITNRKADRSLVKLLSQNALATIKWMQKKGVKFVPTVKFASKKVDKLVLFAVPIEAQGEGKGLSKSLFQSIKKNKIKILYNAKFINFLKKNGNICGVVAEINGRKFNIFSSAVILACGGFESNSRLRSRYLGKHWKKVKVRGTRFNTGDGLKAALEIDAQQRGEWNGCHAIHWDKNAPRYGDRNLTILLSRRKHHMGIIVNSLGKRFIDEGENFPLLTYAKIGQTLLRQPNKLGFQIFDSKIYPLLPKEYHKGSHAKAGSLENLADKLGINKNNFIKTVEKFNESVQKGNLDFSILDGQKTRGIQPPKSNWATTIDSSPFYGFPITCGITFTFGGLAINTDTEVLDKDNKSIPGLYTCGEMVGLFYNNYPGGAGLMAGAVFGKIAGRNAAQFSKT